MKASRDTAPRAIVSWPTDGFALSDLRLHTGVRDRYWVHILRRHGLRFALAGCSCGTCKGIMWPEVQVESSPPAFALRLLALSVVCAPLPSRRCSGGCTSAHGKSLATVRVSSASGSGCLRCGHSKAGASLRLRRFSRLDALASIGCARNAELRSFQQADRWQPLQQQRRSNEWVREVLPPNSAWSSLWSRLVANELESHGLPPRGLRILRVAWLAAVVRVIADLVSVRDRCICCNGQIGLPQSV